MDSQDLIDSLEDCAIIADACSFKIEENKFIVEAKELNSARSEFSSDEISIEAQDSHSRYSLEYLQKFTKAGKQFKKTNINFANDHPMRMDLQKRTPLTKLSSSTKNRNRRLNFSNSYPLSNLSPIFYTLKFNSPHRNSNLL